jgi:hypothetical protein
MIGHVLLQARSALNHAWVELPYLSTETRLRKAYVAAKVIRLCWPPDEGTP